MAKNNIRRVQRQQADFGLTAALIGLAGTLASAGVSASQSHRQRKLQKQMQAAQTLNAENEAAAASMNNSFQADNSTTDMINQQLDYRKGGRVKHRDARKPHVTDGGKARKIGRNLYDLRGRTHEQVGKDGKSGIGVNGIEAENGELYYGRSPREFDIISNSMGEGGYTYADLVRAGIMAPRQAVDRQETQKAILGIDSEGNIMKKGGRKRVQNNKPSLKRNNKKAAARANAPQATPAQPQPTQPAQPAPAQPQPATETKTPSLVDRAKARAKAWNERRQHKAVVKKRARNIDNIRKDNAYRASETYQEQQRRAEQFNHNREVRARARNINQARRARIANERTASFSDFWNKNLNKAKAKVSSLKPNTYNTTNARNVIAASNAQANKQIIYDAANDQTVTPKTKGELRKIQRSNVREGTLSRADYQASVRANRAKVSALTKGGTKFPTSSVPKATSYALRKNIGTNLVKGLSNVSRGVKMFSRVGKGAGVLGAVLTAATLADEGMKYFAPGAYKWLDTLGGLAPYEDEVAPQAKQANATTQTKQGNTAMAANLVDATAKANATTPAKTPASTKPDSALVQQARQESGVTKGHARRISNGKELLYNDTNITYRNKDGKVANMDYATYKNQYKGKASDLIWSPYYNSYVKRAGTYGSFQAAPASKTPAAPASKTPAADNTKSSAVRSLQSGGKANRVNTATRKQKQAIKARQAIKDMIQPLVNKPIDADEQKMLESVIDRSGIPYNQRISTPVKRVATRNGCRVKAPYGIAASSGYTDAQLAKMIAGDKYGTAAGLTDTTGNLASKNYKTLDFGKNNNAFFTTKSDKIGLGIDALTSLGSAAFNLWQTNKTAKPTITPHYDIIAPTIDKTVDNSAEIRQLRRARETDANQISRNTANANVARNLISNSRSDYADKMAQSWENKTNKITELNDQQAQLDMQAAAANQQSYNQWAARRDEAINDYNQRRASGKTLAIGSAIKGLNNAWTNYYRAGNNRFQDMQGRIAAIAASKDGTPSKWLELGGYVDPATRRRLYNYYRNTNNTSMANLVE